MWWLPELNKGQMVRKPNQYFIAILLSSLSLQILQFIFWSWKCMLIHYRSFTGHLSTGFFIFFFLTLCYDQISFFCFWGWYGQARKRRKNPPCLFPQCVLLWKTNIPLQQISQFQRTWTVEMWQIIPWKDDSKCLRNIKCIRHWSIQ